MGDHGQKQAIFEVGPTYLSSLWSHNMHCLCDMVTVLLLVAWNVELWDDAPLSVSTPAVISSYHMYLMPSCNFNHCTEASSQFHIGKRVYGAPPLPPLYSSASCFTLRSRPPPPAEPAALLGSVSSPLARPQVSFLASWYSCELGLLWDIIFVCKSIKCFEFISWTQSLKPGQMGTLKLRFALKYVTI